MRSSQSALWDLNAKEGIRLIQWLNGAAISFIV
jgi:hypothetical protein